MSKIRNSIIALLLVATLIALAGCSGAGGEKQYTSDKTVEEIATEIQDNVEFAMGMAASKEEIKDYYFINTDNYSEIYAYNGMMINADALYIGKIAEGASIEDAKTEFQARLEAITQSFYQYLPDAYEMAQGGQVVTRGDYIMLIISADNAKGIEIFETDIVEK